MCLFVYALKMYRWKYKKPRTEVTCGKGGVRLCSMESQAKDRKKTFHCIAFYILGVLNYVNVLVIQKIK